MRNDLERMAQIVFGVIRDNPHISEPHLLHTSKQRLSERPYTLSPAATPKRALRKLEQRGQIIRTKDHPKAPQFRQYVVSPEAEAQAIEREQRIRFSTFNDG